MGGALLTTLGGQMDWRRIYGITPEELRAMQAATPTVAIVTPHQVDTKTHTMAHASDGSPRGRRAEPLS